MARTAGRHFAVAAGALVDWDLRDAALRGLAAEAGGVLLGSAAFLVARKARKAEQTMLAELRRKSLRELKATASGVRGRHGQTTGPRLAIVCVLTALPLPL